MPLPVTARRQRDATLRQETVGYLPRAAATETILLRREMRGASVERLEFLEWSQRVPEPKTGPLNFEQFPFQPEMYRVFGSSARDVVVRKCLAPETRVLTAELRWVPISELEPGSELLAFDEDDSNGGKRYFRPATVLARWETRKEAVRLTMDDGTEIIASLDHPFLCPRQGRKGGWRKAGEINIGDQIKRMAPRPWGEPTLADAWMGGIIDGEGSLDAKFRSGSAVTVTQSPGLVYDAIIAYLQERGYTFSQRLEHREVGKPVGRILVGRTMEVFKLLGITRPVRFDGKPWWSGISFPARDTKTTVVGVDPLGVRDLIDIETSTGTFIAEGLANHNCTQVGISALTVRWGLFMADRNGQTVLYVFPTEGDVYDFSDARVDPMIDASDYLSSRRSKPWNKGLKRVGIGLVYFRGSQDKHALDSMDVDALALDEYDTLNQKNVPDAERRLSGVMSAGLIRRVGVPSLPQYGIAERYDESDRRKWLVRCPSCEHTGEDQETKEILHVPDGRGGWQEISFWRNVDEEREMIVCQWCREPLDVGKGVWVAQQPDGALPGFHVSRLIVPRMRLGGIIKSSRATSPYDVEVFMNKDLGLPYVSEESRLSPEAIHAAQSAAASAFGAPWVMPEGYDGTNPVTMGVDMASERAMTVRISELLDEFRKRPLYLGEVEDPDELVNLMNRYRVSMAAIDRAPEARIARGLAARFPGRVYLVGYGTEMKQAITVKDDTWDVTVERTVAIDAMVEMVRRQHNYLPAVLPAGYVAEMTAMVRRVKVLDETTGKVRVIWESTRKDDFAHAEVYDLVAAELYWRRLGIEAQLREQFQPLDQLMPFQRTTVNDLSDRDYRPGPGSDPSEGGWDDDPFYET